MAATKGMAVFVNNGEEFNINDPNIAGEFDPSVNYKIEDTVYYQGTLYKFKTAHTAGAWVWGEADPVGVANLIRKNRISSNFIIYFSNGSSPGFSNVVIDHTSSTITVTFPNAEFRIYNAYGNAIVNTSAYSGQSFVVGNLEKLICDFDGTVSVVGVNQQVDAIPLLANCGGNFEGPLGEFYRSIHENLIESTAKNEDDLIVYFSNGGRPSFSVGNSGVNAVITVTLPNSDFRIYQRDGKLVNNKPNAEITQKTFVIANLQKLVYDRVANEFSVIQTNSTQQSSLDKVTLLANCAGVGIGLMADYMLMEKAGQSKDELFNILSAINFADAGFMFFSDIHGGVQNVANIVSKSNAFGNYVNAIINGGDTVDANMSSGEMDWYNQFYDISSKDMLICAGNHDVWADQSTWEKADKSLVYSELIQPMLAKVQNIVQPGDAATSKALYYYKDYGDIRVIVLDAMVNDETSIGWWDNAELSWFGNVLNDAKTYGKHVLCVAHPPYEKSIAVRDNSSPLNSYYDYRTGAPGLAWDNICIPEAALDAVDTFIAAGGSFIGWLTGHTHVDNILTATGHTGQFMISIATARVGRRVDSTRTYSSFSDFWVDLFDYIAIDCTRKTIRVYRIGTNLDQFMRVRHNFCYKWDTCEFIAQ